VISEETLRSCALQSFALALYRAPMDGVRLPVDVDVRGRDALVVGASGEAVSKIERLVAAGAQVRVVAPGEVDARVEGLAASGSITIARRAFEDEDLGEAWVVFVAPEYDALGPSLHAWAVRERRLLSMLDRPKQSTFTNPAVVRAGALAIALSSGGVAPGAMRRLREDLEAIFADPRLPRFFESLRARRAELPPGERKARMHEAVRGFGLRGRLVFPAWLNTDGDRDGD
jgi:precorrin-2 dehydrogenase/sirohydrochlorin ferrochelatase